MDTIIVGFSKPKTWKPFAELIMWGYGIPYDHVYIKLQSDSYDRSIIYQASQLMVNFMGTHIFEESNTVVDEFSVPISPEAKKQLIQFAIDNAGKPYGVKEAIGFAIVRIAELLGQKIKNPFRSGGKTYVCSELVAYILTSFTGDKLSDNYQDMNPLMVYNYLIQLKQENN